MKSFFAGLILAASAFLGGCASDPPNSCTTNVSGCSVSWYSCPAATFCYSTKSACASSGECPP